MKDPLLLEIGCEEIPARMIRAAAADFAARLLAILDHAGLARGEARAWGGTRRVAVRIEGVEGQQADRPEDVLGPPAAAAFTADGAPTPAALGFARKHGVDPGTLRRVSTDRGAYVAFTRTLAGRSVEDVLASALPPSVGGMSFPKTMRWGDGTHRFVRPVHWLLALHGDRTLHLEVFGVRSGNRSRGHRFLSSGPVEVSHPDAYTSTLESAFVVVDLEERRRRIQEALRARAREALGELVEDPALLEEVANIVEWPGVVEGRFEESFLDLPREILVTTLRHHQKCFSVQSGGRLLPVFLAVVNTDRDVLGHIRRGNEWVVGGRLADARFFWTEDRRIPLIARSENLRKVVYHARLGSYSDKAERLHDLARRIGRQVGLDPEEAEGVAEAARLSKNDLTTGVVGEFPELQGIVGGLLLREEGRPEAEVRGVYEHYAPAGAEDSIPPSVSGSIVSVADKLDAVGQLVQAEGIPTGSKDPFGLRRMMNGVFRIVEGRGWALTVADLTSLAGGSAEAGGFVQERFAQYLRERGYTTNEVQAVLRPQISPTEFTTWTFDDIVARLDAIRTVRGREDFQHLVDLTKRVDNILVKGAREIERAIQLTSGLDGYVEKEPAALALAALIEDALPRMRKSSDARRYRETVEIMSGFIEPVDRFFAEVLVIDPKNPDATFYRKGLLASRLKPLLTQYFDIRELAGQAEKRS